MDDRHSLLTLQTARGVNTESRHQQLHCHDRISEVAHSMLVTQHDTLGSVSNPRSIGELETRARIVRDILVVDSFKHPTRLAVHVAQSAV